jgi:hypothetical protein
MQIGEVQMVERTAQIAVDGLRREQYLTLLGLQKANKIAESCFSEKVFAYAEGVR